MSTKTYKIASEEAVFHYGGEIGAEVELDLGEAELAVVAAGWIEPVEPAKTKKKEG